MNTARKIFPLITLQKQQASANTTLPDCLSSLQIPPITNTLIAKELIMPCCSYPIPIFLSRRQHFSLVSPVFPPFFASSVLSNNVRLRNSAICIFIRKNCRKIPNSCCFRFCSFDTRYNTKNFLFLLFLRFPSSNDSHDSDKEPDLLFPLQSDSFSAVIQNRSNRLLLQYFLFGDTTVAFPLFLSANKSCTSASVKPTYGAILPASIMHHWTSK